MMASDPNPPLSADYNSYPHQPATVGTAGGHGDQPPPAYPGQNAGTVEVAVEPHAQEETHNGEVSSIH